MAKLIVQYTSGQCSGPLQTYLRTSRALVRAQEDLNGPLSSGKFLQSLPYEWLFIHVRYGCAAFDGRPTATTSTTPTPEWKFDKRRSEYLAFVSLNGGDWEKHDKAAGKRIHLSPEEIARQVEVAVVSAMMWIAQIQGVSHAELREIKAKLGDIPGAQIPGDPSSDEILRLLARKRAEKVRTLPSGEPLYREIQGGLEYLEVIPVKGDVVVKRGKVGERALHEIKRPRSGESVEDIAKNELQTAAREGFALLPEEGWIDLEVVAPMDGFGTRDDDSRKNRIAEILRKELPMIGLGTWTGDSIGSGTFEVGVRVADESIARRVIPEILRRHGLDANVDIEEL